MKLRKYKQTSAKRSYYLSAKDVRSELLFQWLKDSFLAQLKGTMTGRISSLNSQ